MTVFDLRAFENIWSYIKARTHLYILTQLGIAESKN